MRDLCILCLRNTATDVRRRRVFEILFLKCEFVEEMGPVMARHQTDMREGLASIEQGLRNAMSKGQLPADLDAKRASRVLHSFIGGALRDMAILPDAFDVASNAELHVDAMLDALRFSPSLRIGASESEA
jgi:TetR/AcrR family acrAB operon transcriptional repressor